MALTNWKIVVVFKFLEWFQLGLLLLSVNFGILLSKFDVIQKIFFVNVQVIFFDMDFLDSQLKYFER